MNINIAILEDSIYDYETLKENLMTWSSMSKNVVHIFWFPSEENIYDEFEKHSFDILFSDIKLTTNIDTSGLEICGKLRKQGYSGEIIFLTAFTEYVFDGYNVHAFNFLLKPIKYNKLLVCMDRYCALHKSDYYYYHKGNDVIQLPYDQIIYFLKDSHDVIIQLPADVYIERVTLNEIEDYLPSNFQRCHKSCIINILHIRSIVGNTVYLSNNKTQTIGRNYLAQIRSMIINSFT